MPGLQGEPKRVEVQSFAEQEDEHADLDVLCARCYSLRHYGCARPAAAPWRYMQWLLAARQHSMHGRVDADCMRLDSSISPCRATCLLAAAAVLLQAGKERGGGGQHAAL